ncbi:hypothetical protein N474_09880 [Pseudoalteromonas luteoviolacea CPMOR-2]|uniref:Uncharacterized protein n=2 Tax=Pseudoalteromonas luteoviolacea TaxID=43657 RepID=A0A166WZ35_9GAMM|nr:hypothetical protein N475_14705 [Pseudoalteromonas luteoviolacea DSM 6061]KZN56920.1 hypothetical protein N474_09880 [Pseudoalteromonas luteoviolacea CPMOR-2]MBE0389951.1 hypothetical protein [Pseudoalteromonas luteoviolacea DSM 6061]
MYKNADRLALNRLEELVELDAEQERYFLTSFADFQVIHQKAYMPDYVRWLTSLEGNWRSLSQSQLRELGTDIQEHWANLSQSMNDPVTKLLVDLNAQQKEELIAALKKRAEERSKNTSRLERALERFEDILGDLSVQQRKIVEKYFDETEYYRQVWLLYSQKRINKIESLLANDKALTEQERKLLGSYIFNSMQHAPSHILRTRDQWVEKQLQLMLELRETLTSQQQEHVDEYFKKWLGVVNELIQTKL